MTVLALHGIGFADAPAPADAPNHLRIPVGHLCAIATPTLAEVFADETAPPLAQAQAHHAILSAYAATQTVLPVRFGAVFSDRDAIACALRRSAPTYEAGLTALGDGVEYVVKVMAEAEGGQPAALPLPDISLDGRAFLGRKRALRDDRRHLVQKRATFCTDLIAQLAGVSRALPLKTGAPETLLSAALLVPRAAIPAMLASARGCGEQATALGLKLALVGPGPCYAFADEVVADVGDGAEAAQSRVAAHG